MLHIHDTTNKNTYNMNCYQESNITLSLSCDDDYIFIDLKNNDVDLKQKYDIHYFKDQTKLSLHEIHKNMNECILDVELKQLTFSRFNNGYKIVFHKDFINIDPSIERHILYVLIGDTMGSENIFDDTKISIGNMKINVKSSREDMDIFGDDIKNIHSIVDDLKKKSNNV
jgi:hypothetical protein